MTLEPRDGEHFVVCGMGHVGRRIALLLRRLGYSVSAVYDSAPEEWIGEATTAGVTCFQGDARNEQVLLKAGVAQAHAIIAATDRDMVNLSVALDGLQANPGIVTVIRLYDQELGRQLQPGLNVRQVLSASALAAPMFVAAALGQEAIAYFDYRGQHYVLTDNGTDGTVQENACPLIQLNADTPSPHGLSIQLLTGGGKARAPWPLRTALDLLGHVSPGMRWLAAGLVLLLLAGVGVAHVSLGLDYLDALYFIVTTITTTGYGDISLLNAPTSMKIFGCFLMMSGAAILALLFGIITDAVISNRFRGAFAGQRIRLREHVIVAGSGHIMIRTLEELTAEGHQIAAVCPSDTDAKALWALRVPFIEGDARMESVLRRAGIETASAFITVHDDDALNLGAGLLAKRLNPEIRTVVRVYDGTLADKLQHQLDVDRVLSSSAVAAPPFVAASLYEKVLCATLWQNHLLIVCTVNNVRESFTDELSVSLYIDEESGIFRRLETGNDPSVAMTQPGIHVRLLPLRTLES